MNMRTLRTSFLALVPILFFMVSNPGSAHAQSGSKAAKVHADKALKEYNLGHFAEAISEYEKAYEIDSAPILLFNIATAHRKAGNDEKALFFYGRYLDQAPDAPNKSDVEQRIRELKTKIAKQNEVGEKPSTTPPPAPVLPRVDPTPQVSTPVVVLNPPPPPPATPPPDRRSTLRTAGWITGAGAVVALGAGVALQLVESKKFSDFDKRCGVNEKGEIVMEGAGPPVDCVSLHQKWEDSKTWPIVGYVAGGALAVTTLTLFLLARPSHENRGDQTAHVGCRAGLGEFSCRLVF